MSTLDINQQPLMHRLKYYWAVSLAEFRKVWYRLVRRRFDRIVWLLWASKIVVPLKALSRRNAFQALEQETRLWIDPAVLARIIYVKESRFPKRDFISDSDWDLRYWDFKDNPRYRMLSDLYRHRGDLTQSQTFKDLRARADEGHPVTIIKKSLFLDTDEAILDYLEEQVGLLDSVAEKGVIDGVAHDDIKVAIDRDGRMVKANDGRKRSSAAVIVGAPALPVRVCHVHQAYLEPFLRASKRRDRAVREALAAVRERYGLNP